MELANLLFIQAKKPGSYLFGLGSKEVLGVFLAEGRFYIRRCIHLNGPLIGAHSNLCGWIRPSDSKGLSSHGLVT